MPRDYHKEAEQEDSQKKLRKAWVQTRVEAILNRVSAFVILRRYNAQLQQSGENRIEQISCPFHGKDNKPSARIFPASAKGPSHVWCYVCQERWDAIGLWRKYNDDTVPFTRSLMELERAYGLPTPEIPNVIDMRDAIRKQEYEELEKLLNIAERRLFNARDAFDMKAYLTLGSVLDKLHSRFEAETLQGISFRATIRKILDKIGDRCRVAS